jgi:hypothetical protein
MFVGRGLLRSMLMSELLYCNVVVVFHILGKKTSFLFSRMLIIIIILL